MKSKHVANKSLVQYYNFLSNLKCNIVYDEVEILQG